jgi:hypothetical protein
MPSPEGIAGMLKALEFHGLFGTETYPLINYPQKENHTCGPVSVARSI